MSVAKIDNIGGGVKIKDFNPEKTTNAGYGLVISKSGATDINISGYARCFLNLRNWGSGTITIGLKFYDASGTQVGTSRTYSTILTWFEVENIPDGAMIIDIYMTSASSIAQGGAYYSLLTKDSPYNT